METKSESDFPRFKSDPKAKSRRKPMGETPFVCECRAALRNLLESSDLSRPRKRALSGVSGVFRFGPS